MDGSIIGDALGLSVGASLVTEVGSVEGRALFVFDRTLLGDALGKVFGPVEG